MKHKIILLAIAAFAALEASAARPRLVVNIVVGSMRAEDLSRYADNYGEGGLRRLIDGGTVNPLPLNRVRREEGDLLIAVDVCAPFAAAPAAGKVSLNYYRMLTASSQIMQQHIAGLMRRLYRPDVVVELPADSFSMFEFYRSEEIVEAGRRATCEALERRAAGD